MALRIKEIRKQNKEKQETIGRLLGVSQNTVSRYENGEIDIPTDKLIQLATHWKVSIDSLVGFSIPADQKAA